MASGTWIAVGVVIILASVWYFGFNQPSPVPIGPGPVQPTAIPTQPAIVATPIPTESITGSLTLLDNEHYADNVVDGAPMPLDFESFEEESCGDFTCQSSERCDTCPQDCGCTGEEYCSGDNGVCYPSE